jgi:hypothetical protein
LTRRFRRSLARPGTTLLIQSDTMSKPARFLTFKCAKCAKPVKVTLQKVSALSHVQPYQGICECGEIKRHATGNPDAVKSFVESNELHWHHHH